MNAARRDVLGKTIAPLAIALVCATQPGCQTFGAASYPARLIEPTPACLDELRQFAEASTGREVSVTSASFAQDDELLLERRLLRGPDGRLLDGRSMDRPELLRLVRRNNACIAIHPKSEIKRALNRCQCEEVTH
jgi:hypothetical protein